MRIVSVSADWSSIPARFRRTSVGHLCCSSESTPCKGTVHPQVIGIPLTPDVYLQEIHANALLWGPILFSTKLALLLLFWRLFHSSNILRYMIYFGIAFHFLLYTSYMFLSFFLCPRTFATRCLNQLNMFIIVMTSLNISGDFYLLFLPIFAVARLQIPTRFKLSLVAVFSTGLLCVTAFHFSSI